ncbi:conserved exported hypothetical protein [Candidatus Sulfopaludibacter sp. SbA3]|nr:conserved exported hypothetical protein [Candidatus Sulfopaludibacter sp. SbA3]
MIGFCLALLGACAFGQTFEVASVKQSAPQSGARPQVVIKGGPGTSDPGQITWLNIPMRAVLLRTFDAKNYQLSAPKWVDEERYDIVAKIPPGSSQEQTRGMLRNLLKERFKMAAREETKEGPVYALVTGKSAVKLKESAVPAVSAVEAAAAEPARGQPRLSSWRTDFPLYLPAGRE